MKTSATFLTTGILVLCLVLVIVPVAAAQQYVDLPVVTALNGPDSVSYEASGPYTLTAKVTGGSPPYSYRWLGGSRIIAEGPQYSSVTVSYNDFYTGGSGALIDLQVTDSRQNMASWTDGDGIAHWQFSLYYPDTSHQIQKLPSYPYRQTKIPETDDLGTVPGLSSVPGFSSLPGAIKTGSLPSSISKGTVPAAIGAIGAVIGGLLGTVVLPPVETDTAPVNAPPGPGNRDTSSPPGGPQPSPDWGPLPPATSSPVKPPTPHPASPDWEPLPPDTSSPVKPPGPPPASPDWGPIPPATSSPVSPPTNPDTGSTPPDSSDDDDGSSSSDQSDPSGSSLTQAQLDEGLEKLFIRMQSIVDDKILNGYFVRNDTLIDKAWNNTLGYIKNEVIGSDTGGQCGEYTEWGKEWTKGPVKEIFGSDTIITDIVIEQNPLINHRAVKIILPDGHRFVLDYWEGISTGDAHIYPENVWIEKWQDMPGFNHTADIQRTPAEQSLETMIREYGEEQGIKLFKSTSQNPGQAEAVVNSYRLSPWFNPAKSEPLRIPKIDHLEGKGPSGVGHKW